MISYNTPTRDFNFILNDLLAIDSVLHDLGYDNLAATDLHSIVEEIGHFAEKRVLPINGPSDLEGCVLQNGKVRTPTGMRQVFADYAKAGWTGLICDVGDEGQGMPQFLGLIAQEILSSASLTFADYTALFCFGYKLLSKWGSEELKCRYLAGIARGTVGATMCMTEPHCGTDLGLLKTRAERGQHGGFRVSGTKIFISGGDHDLTENIVHFVLARISGSPAASKGVSLFLVPKLLPSAHGTTGVANTIEVVSLEHKMGYAGSATCQLSFDGATAWLVGEENRGLAAIFTMVNLARLSVSNQGISTAEIGYQNAARYARSRLQGRAAAGGSNPSHPADPLIVHPDVRRMLLRARAIAEGGRAAYIWLAMHIDIAARHPDLQAREDAEDLLGLLTGILKATLSDLGISATDDCLQVFGGHGYIRAVGMEQLVRDVRIAQIQEGANGVLAADLLRRQLPKNGSRAFRKLVASMESFCAANHSPETAPFVHSLRMGISSLQEITSWVQAKATVNPDEIGAAGVDYQRIFGLVLLTWIWGRIAAAAAHRIQDKDNQFYLDKIATGRFFIERCLPMIHGHAATIKSGAAAITEPATDYFS